MDPWKKKCDTFAIISNEFLGWISPRIYSEVCEEIFVRISEGFTWKISEWIVGSVSEKILCKTFEKVPEGIYVMFMIRG